MILTGKEIKKKYFDNLIKIDPFSVENITTNSYDISLGHNLLRYTSEVIDPKKENSYEIFTIPTSGHLMTAGTFLLGETLEKFGSDHYVPIIHGKSGIARMGLFVHITADLFDIGYYGKSTLQLFATLPVRLFAEMKIAQVTFWKPKGVIELYRGKYQNSSKPTPSQIFRDFS
jgi:dCTP deaminase